MSKFQKRYNEIMSEASYPKDLEKKYNQILADNNIKPGKNDWKAPMSIIDFFPDTPDLEVEIAKTLKLKLKDTQMISANFLRIFGDGDYDDDINTISLLQYIIGTQLKLKETKVSKELEDAFDDMDHWSEITNYGKIVFSWTGNGDFVSIFGTKAILSKLLKLIPDGTKYPN